MVAEARAPGCVPVAQMASTKGPTGRAKHVASAALVIIWMGVLATLPVRVDSVSRVTLQPIQE